MKQWAPVLLTTALVLAQGSPSPSPNASPSPAYCAPGQPRVGDMPWYGYPGAKLQGTYFWQGGSAQCFHLQRPVSWTFAGKVWTSSPAPALQQPRSGPPPLQPYFASSTLPTSPPPGTPPGTFQVCGYDPEVSPSPACVRYVVEAPPSPTARPQPSPSAAPNSSSSAAASPSPSPAASTAPVAAGGGGPSAFRPVGRGGGIPLWPWSALLLLLFAAAGALILRIRVTSAVAGDPASSITHSSTVSASQESEPTDGGQTG
jgi:hypothetical protein